jgi:hypothetical protein
LSDHFFRSYPYFILDQIEKLARHSAWIEITALEIELVLLVSSGESLEILSKVSEITLQRAPHPSRMKREINTPDCWKLPDSRLFVSSNPRM